MHAINKKKKQRKFIDSYVHAVNKKSKESTQIYNMEEKNDWHARCKQNKKKVNKFLQYGRKKMIYVHTVNKKKQRNWDFCGDSLQWIYVYS